MRPARAALAAAALFAATPAAGQGPAPRRLVGPDWLLAQAAAPDLVIVHADRDRAAYDAGHIPGARFLAYTDYAVTRDGLDTELRPVAELVELLEGLGVSNTTRVVIYGGLLQATRLAFTLDYLGHAERTFVLDGGMAAWRAAGGGVSREAPAAARGRFSPALRPGLLVDATAVRERLGRADVLLLDARTPEEYRGERGGDDPERNGHIPGAVLLNWEETVAGERFLPPAEVRRLFERAGAAPGREVITYCRTGARSAVLYFLATELGLPAAMYDGSMSDWSARSALPVTRGPDPE